MKPKTERVKASRRSRWRRFGLVIKLVVMSALAMLAALVIWRVILQLMVDRKMAINSARGIDSLEPIRLGGIEQWITIRGRDRAKPLLVFLHGGPGFPQMPFDRLNADLEKHFVVVQWDQRGTGKSYSPSIPADSMRVAQFVSDAHELVEILLKRFGAPKCYLVAHSWGSLVGALTVTKYPELFYAYVGIGQVVSPPEMQQVRYQYALDAAQKEQNTKALSALRKIGRPPYENFDDSEILDHWVKHYSRIEHTPVAPSKFVWLAFGSPAYSWADLARIARGVKFSFAQLWKEIFYQTNLFDQAPRIDVPVFFFHGRYDQVVTTQVTQRYFDGLDAPRGKQLIWFENSAHWPHFEEAQKYRDELVNRVLLKTHSDVNEHD